MTPVSPGLLTRGTLDSHHLYVVGEAQTGPGNAVVYAECVVGGSGGSTCL